MSPSFSYPELQRKFCEGFTFLPFKSLMQHNDFIYKSYAIDDATPEVLDRHNQQLHPAKIHAFVLLRKLQQNDIPAAEKLLNLLSCTVIALKRHARALSKQGPPFIELVSNIDAYFTILTVYQLRVQQRIAIYLGPQGHPEREENPVSMEDINSVQVLIREFLASTDLITSPLQDSISTMPGAGKLALPQNERETVYDLLKTILQFAAMQEKTDYVLEQWKTAAINFDNQHLLN